MALVEIIYPLAGVPFALFVGWVAMRKLPKLIARLVDLHGDRIEVNIVEERWNGPKH
jgi:hypothetical protein